MIFFASYVDVYVLKQIIIKRAGRHDYGKNPG